MLLDRINAAWLALLLAIAPLAPAGASQNTLSSPTTGTVSGLQLTNNYNAALDSLNTANSGATAPTNQLSGSASLGNLWLNTSAAPYGLGMFDGAANWPVLGSLDPSAHAWNLQIGGGAATLASAATVDLCSTPRNYLTISGAVTITSFGSICPAGVVKLVAFSGALTLTYNATSLIIPGAANVLTAAGDQATLVSNGGGNWQVASYTPASGAALINPAIDVGAVEWTFSPNLPSSKYLWAYGQTFARATYPALLTALTITQSVTRTNGSPTLTGFSDTTQIRTGANVEGAGIGSSLTIVSCTSTTCALSGNASSSGTANVTIFAYGNGDGSTTFQLPDCRDVVMAGRGNMGGSSRGLLTSGFVGVNPDALGAAFGGQSTQLSASNVPTITSSDTTNITVTAPSSYSLAGVAPGNAINQVQMASASTGLWVPYIGTNAWTGIASLQSGAITLNSTSTNTSGSGSGAAFSLVQPTTTANCMIRVLASRVLPQHFAANDTPRDLVADRRRAA